MQTRILVIRFGKVVDRRYLAADAPKDDGYQAQRIATYRDPHWVNSHGVTVAADGRVKAGKERRTWVPARIQVGQESYEVASLATGKSAPRKAGGKVVSKAMVISAEDAAELELRDGAVNRAIAARHEFMLEAAERGHILTRAECVDKTPASK